MATPPLPPNPPPVVPRRPPTPPPPPGNPPRAPMTPLDDFKYGDQSNVNLRPMFVRILSPIPLPVAIVSGAPPGGRTPPSGDRGGFFAWLTRNISLVQQVGSNVIGNRGAPAAVQLANATANAIPGVAGKVAGAFTSLADATIKLVHSFNERGQELARFSGPLAQATANAKVQGTLADIREAEQLGPDMARLMDASTDIWIDIRDHILVPIKKLMLDILVPILEAMRDIMETIGPYIEAIIAIIGDVGTAIVKAITFRVQGAIEALERIPDNVAKAFEKRDKSKNLFEDLLRKTLQNTPAFQNQAAPAAGGGVLNAPVFQGI